MLLRRKMNTVYRDSPSWRDGSMVGIYVDGDIEMVSWLGTVERVIAARLPNARKVRLDFEGWRRDITDAIVWLNKGEFVVGVMLGDGVFAVTEYSRPLIKR